MLGCPFSTHRSRLTSSGLFEHETIRAYATTKLLELHTRSLFATSEVKLDFVARYLLERPHTESTATNSNFSALINSVVDELVRYDYDDGGEPEQLRYQYIETLCHCVSRQQGLNSLLRGIFPQSTDPVSRVEHSYHVLVAAVYLGKSSVAQHILEHEHIDLAEVKSELLGTPLHAALQIGRDDMVRMLLKHGADVNMERPFTTGLPLETAVENRNEETVRLLLEPHYGHITSGTPFEKAIQMSCETCQPRLAHFLLERMSTKLSESRYLLSEGLRAACRRGMVDIVVLLLDNGGDVNEYLSSDRSYCVPSLIEQAAWTGQEEVLRLLLARGAGPYGGDPNDPGCFSSMRAAVWGGHVGAARILLDAGAELRPKHWMGILNPAVYLAESAELVRMLLDRGNFDHHQLDEDSQKAEYYVASFMGEACQHGNLGFVQGLAQHGVPVDDRDFYARHEFPPPIVVAMAFRQDHVVRGLRELGAREVDPLDTTFAEGFANGKYPCDPPPPRECRMPWIVV